jgi:aryl-alcohol dehydrogenase-like predicted oxidoreductase
MNYVRLGTTGLKVSRICLGMMTYGTPKWRPWVLDEEASRPFVKRALELGINFFDTADMYCDGASEEVLGRAIRDFARPGVSAPIAGASRIEHLDDAVAALDLSPSGEECCFLEEPYLPHSVRGHS